MARVVKELTNMEIDEISLVERPANAHAKVVIAKSDDVMEESVPEIFNEEGDLLDEESLSEGDVVFDSEGEPFLVVPDEELVGKSDVLEDELTEEDVELLEEAFDKPLDEITDEDLQDLEDYVNDDDIEKGVLTGAKRVLSDGTEAALGSVSSKAPKVGKTKSVHVAGPNSGGTQFKGATDATKNLNRGQQLDPKKVAGTTAAAGAVTAALGGAAAGAKALKGSKNATGFGAHLSRNKKAYGIGAGALGAGGLAGGAYGMSQKDKFGKSASFADELREELSKSMNDLDRDEAISKAMEQVADMEEYLVEAQEIAKSERDLRLRREYEEVAKSYNLPVDSEELAPALMAIAEYLPEEYGSVIHKSLSAAGEILFEEMGMQGAADNNDVLYAVDEFIDGNVSKSDNISKAEAVEAVFADNPQAYDEYMATRY